jgi:hypothetical protein
VIYGFKYYSENTFDTVDHKIAEAEFFLQRMSESGLDGFKFNCYLSAYLSASRTTTLALQRFRHIPGFAAWYAPHRDRLKADRLAKLFLDLRNDHVHGGQYPVSGSSHHLGKSTYFLKNSVSGEQQGLEDAVAAALDHFIVLLSVVHDCYVTLGVHIDPQQHYTREHFDTLGRGIDHAECEVWGWVCTHLIEEGLSEEDRWHELRGHVDECHINHLFYSYLGMATPQPVLPDYLEEIEYTPEERGWLHVPAGYKSIEDFTRDRSKLRAD